METVQSVWNFFGTWGWLVIYLATLLSILIAIILENRNPVKSIAYILILIFLPGLGFVVYFFFGRDFRRKIKMDKYLANAGLKLKEFVDRSISSQFQNLTTLENEFGGLAKPALMLSNEGRSQLFFGNTYKLLINGEQKFPEVYEACQKAEHHIHLGYYILSDDDVGRKLGEIILERAAKGVEIRIFVDDVGSTDLGELPDMFMEAGIEFIEFLPVRFTSLAATNYRNHRKILVIDGKVGFIGGINLDDRYLNNGKHPVFWRDTHLRVVGPIVDGLQLQFLMDWQYATKKQFPIEKPYFMNYDMRPDGVAMTMVSSGPLSTLPFGLSTMVSLIHNAGSHVRITNPYYIPSPELESAIIMAATSGIKVEMILPGISDSVVMKGASNTYIKHLLENGVDVYFYDKGFIHTKSLTVDGRVSLIGSMNADIRSFFINFESSILVYDENLADQLNDEFDRDMVSCRKLNLEQWEKRSLPKKLRDSFFRLITPLL